MTLSFVYPPSGFILSSEGQFSMFSDREMGMPKTGQVSGIIMSLSSKLNSMPFCLALSLTFLNWAVVLSACLRDFL